eukprot:m.124101 g.124101  ORF g.124101 m.124101 type:complete len:420 (-) comp15693_c0_seq1:1717-2976(-)
MNTSLEDFDFFEDDPTERVTPLPSRLTLVSADVSPPKFTLEARQHILKELVSTEETFVSNLENVLILAFQLPLVAHRIISVKEAAKLFTSQLNRLLQVHKRFLTDIKARQDGWSRNDMIGDVFAKFFGSVDLKLEEVYAVFLQEFPTAIDTFFKLMKNDDAFLAYHSSIIASHPEVQNLSLASFLLTPVQRLPRYMLLLREFAKATPEGHCDTYYLTKAQDKLSGLLRMLNEGLQQSNKLFNEHIRRRAQSRTMRPRGKSRSSRPQSLALRDIQVTDNHRRHSSLVVPSCSQVPPQVAKSVSSDVLPYNRPVRSRRRARSISSSPSVDRSSLDQETDPVGVLSSLATRSEQVLDLPGQMHTSIDKPGALASGNPRSTITASHAKTSRSLDNLNMVHSTRRRTTSLLSMFRRRQKDTSNA